MEFFFTRKHWYSLPFSIVKGSNSYFTCFAGARGSKNLSCDVAIVGGGISGLYMADTLLRLHQERNVCLFEKENTLGGRILDHTFERLPDIPISKSTC